MKEERLMRDHSFDVAQLEMTTFYLGPGQGCFSLKASHARADKA